MQTYKRQISHALFAIRPITNILIVWKVLPVVFYVTPCINCNLIFLKDQKGFTHFTSLRKFLLEMPTMMKQHSNIGCARLTRHFFRLKSRILNVIYAIMSVRYLLLPFYRNAVTTIARLAFKITTTIWSMSQVRFKK